MSCIFATADNKHTVDFLEDGPHSINTNTYYTLLSFMGCRPAKKFVDNTILKLVALLQAIILAVKMDKPLQVRNWCKNHFKFIFESGIQFSLLGRSISIITVPYLFIGTWQNADGGENMKVKDSSVSRNSFCCNFVVIFTSIICLL